MAGCDVPVCPGGGVVVVVSVDGPWVSACMCSVCVAPVEEEVGS